MFRFTSIFFISLFLTLPSILKAQTDTLNRFNSKGKKDGYWKVFLDDNVNPVDSAQANFYAYELWSNGNSVFKYYKHTDVHLKRTFDGAIPERGNPLLIDGTFKWYNTDNLLKNVEIYQNGHPVFYKSYLYEKNVKAHSFSEVIYFDKKYNQIPGTFYYEEYGSNGRLDMRGWYRNGKRGWQTYETMDVVAVPKIDTLINPPLILHNDTIIPLPKWPYVNDRTPPLIGIIVGYNFYKDQSIELGAIINISNNNISHGAILGPSLLYRRDFTKNINSVDFDLGFYFPFTMGIGTNYTFNSSEGILGFKPFVGFSFYHFQLTYGYNFFNNKKNDVLNISPHCLKLRYTIPFYKINP